MLCKPFLYLSVCLVVRALLAYAVKRTPAHRLPIVGALALIPAIGFTLIYLADWRRGPVTETGSGCTVWWNALRPVHAAMYWTTALYAIKRETTMAYLPLVIDVLVGLVAGVWRLTVD
jgi:hypothetical protein